MSILDEKTEVIRAHLPKIVAEIISQPKWSVTKGVSRFIKDISDLAVDCLDLVEWFFNLVLWPMIDSKKLAVKELQWLNDKEDIFTLGGHYELMAQLISHKARQTSMAAAIAELKPMVGSVVTEMIKKYAEDSSVMDIDEVKEAICKATGLDEKNEMFKFLGLSQ